MAQALKEMKKIGMKNIHKRIQNLVNYLYDQSEDKILMPYNSINRSGIILMKGERELQEKLNSQKIVTTLRGKGIRIGLHFYNQFEDIDKLVALLRKK